MPFLQAHVAGLILAIGLTDTVSMLDFEMQELMEDLSWQQVLVAYRDARDEGKAAALVAAKAAAAEAKKANATREATSDDQPSVDDATDDATPNSATADNDAEVENDNGGFDGWLPRIMAIDGVDDADSPRWHGKLIALGYLKFQLAGRSEGVRYQITSAGIKAIDAFQGETVDADDDINESTEFASEDATDDAVVADAETVTIGANGNENATDDEEESATPASVEAETAAEVVEITAGDVTELEAVAEEADDKAAAENSSNETEILLLSSAASDEEPADENDADDDSKAAAAA